MISNNLEGLQRLQEEITIMKTLQAASVSAQPINESNPFDWQATIAGPEGSPYEERLFQIQLKFDEDKYPKSPPKAKFVSPIFHPNVYPNGDVCISVLASSTWDPNISIGQILASIQCMLKEPNWGSVANSKAGEIYSSGPDGPKKFEEAAKK